MIEFNGMILCVLICVLGLSKCFGASFDMLQKQDFDLVLVSNFVGLRVVILIAHYRNTRFM